MSTVIESHYQPQTTVPEVKFQLTAVPPPSQLYVGREDRLSITSFNSATGVTLELHTRLLLPNGTVVPGVQSQIPNTNRTSATTTISLAEGFLLSVLVVVAAGTVKRGQCYVLVTLARGDNTTPINHQVVVQGYVAGSVHQGWPGNRLEQPSDGPGWLRSIQGTQPGAGNEIIETVPTGARWRLKTFRPNLTTSATAGTRRPQLVVDDSVNNFFNSPHVDTIAPSQNNIAVDWSEGAWLSAAIATANDQSGLPFDLRMAAGWRVRTQTISISATDQWSAPLYMVEEWIEP